MNASARVLAAFTAATSLVGIAGLGVTAGIQLNGAASVAIWIATAVAMTVVGCCNWLLMGRVFAPLGDLVLFGEKILQGDLTAVPKTPAFAEVGEVQRIISSLKDTLLTIVYDVRGGAISIDTTVLSVHTNNQTLSQRNESQSQSIKATSANLADLSATLAQNSENAVNASQQIRAANTQVAGCNQLVRQVASTMESIRSSSNKIADIVAVIDGIAFQTNILALNAAVEAARAGEQGRGFAVVASEVRSLAGRSASEAKNIRKLVTEAVQNVESGSALVSKADQAMLEVVSSIKGINEYMSAIAAASSEQTTNMAQIAGAVEEFAAMTHDNSDLATKALAASVTLKESAKSLAEGVSGYFLGSEAGTADEAQSLVQKAVALAKEEGLQALIDEVNQLNKGKFVYKDLYLSLYGLDSKVKAHGANRHFVGVDASQVKDTSGKAFITEILEEGRRNGSGWVNYLFAHPTTQEIRPKASYLELVGDVVISCGCYI